MNGQGLARVLCSVFNLRYCEENAEVFAVTPRFPDSEQFTNLLHKNYKIHKLIHNMLSKTFFIDLKKK